MRADDTAGIIALQDAGRREAARYASVIPSRDRAHITIADHHTVHQCHIQHARRRAEAPEQRDTLLMRPVEGESADQVAATV